jgi:hypothetical protein
MSCVGTPSVIAQIRFKNRIAGERRRHEDHRRRRACRLNRIGNRIEDRQAVVVLRSTLAWRDAADHLRPVLEATARVECPG